MEELKANPNKIRFKRLCQIAESFGFESLNEDGWAKAYSMRQFIKVIENYNLQED